MSGKRTILLATSRLKDLQSFARALEERRETALVIVGTADAAFQAAERKRPALAVIDRHVNGADATAIARRLLKLNAFIHTAILSDLSEAAFHEASEGLGVLMKLPMKPGAGDAELLMAKLDEMTPARKPPRQNCF
jgi:ActR/RegA family two-component response regulator